MESSPSSSSYVCDTLPAPRLASAASAAPESLRSPSPPSTFQVTEQVHTQKMDEDDSIPDSSEEHNVTAQPPARKLCVRHQRMADEGTNLKLQQVSPSSMSGLDSSRASGSTPFLSSVLLFFLSAHYLSFSPWMHSPSKNERPSMRYGQTFLHLPIPAVP